MRKLICVGLLLLVNHAMAQSAAIVLFAEKKVIAKRNGVERIIARGSTLDPGDEVITAEGALANIQYSNGALVNIGANTHYKILAYAPKQSDIEIKAELQQGKIEVKTTKKIKESLKTPIVSLAISGTDFRVYVPSSKIADIQVIEGCVWLRNKRYKYLCQGASVEVTSEHIVNAPFPQKGVVVSPANAPGGITLSTVSVPELTGASGADAALFLATAQMPGVTAADPIETLQGVMVADISIICQNPLM